MPATSPPLVLATLALALCACGDSVRPTTRTSKESTSDEAPGDVVSGNEASRESAPRALHIEKLCEDLPDLTSAEIARIRSLAEEANPGVPVRTITYSRTHPGEHPVATATFDYHQTLKRIRRSHAVSFELEHGSDAPPPAPAWVPYGHDVDIHTEVCRRGHSFLDSTPVPPSDVTSIEIYATLADESLLEIVDAMSEHVPEGQRLSRIIEEGLEGEGVYEIYTVDATRKRGLSGSVFEVTWSEDRWAILSEGMWVS